MRQCRIVKITSDDKVEYQIEEHAWFIFFYWSVITQFDCCTDGACAGNYPLTFDTLEAAEKWLINFMPHTEREIVKYITL